MIDAVTVYPARHGGFPPASFYHPLDALAYARAMIELGVTGACTCPASNFWSHWLSL